MKEKSREQQVNMKKKAGKQIRLNEIKKNLLNNTDGYFPIDRQYNQ